MFVVVGAGASLIIQFVGTVVLSRLLSPSDFGLIAMVAIFVALGNLLRDFGLPLAGLQERRLTHQQASNLFWMSVGVSGVAALGLTIATPFLVWLFNEPRLTPIVPALAIVVFLGGASAQLQVQLARSLRFRALVVTDVGGQSVGLAVAIIGGLAGAGYWALVYQSLVAASLTLGLRWFACRWRPQVPRKGHGSSRLFKSGAFYGLAQLLTFGQSNIDTLLIGAKMGPMSLGYYNRAYQLLTAPAGRLLDPLTQVIVSSLNKRSNKDRDAVRFLEIVQFGVGSVIVWIFAVSGGSAETLVPILLGNQWSASIVIFQVLAVGGAFAVFNHISYCGFIASEQPRALLHYNLVSKPLGILCIVIGVQFGLVGAAWGYVASMALSWPINLGWLKSVSSFSPAPFLKNGIVILLAGTLAAATTATFTRILSVESIVLNLVASVLGGTFVMFGVLLLFRRSRRRLQIWYDVGVSALSSAGTR